MSPRSRALALAITLALVPVVTPQAAEKPAANVAAPRAAASSAAKSAPRSAERAADALAALEQTQEVFRALAQRVRPAVVTVRRFTKDEAWWKANDEARNKGAGWQVVPANDMLYPGHRPGRGMSGFLVSADGYMVTLHRAVIDPRTSEAAPIVSVEVGADHFQAEVVALEPTLDIAILKLNTDTPFAFVRFGDSTKSPVGHWAIAFGDPDGSEQNMVPGFVSVQPSRECYQDDLSATYMQTSVPVSDAALGGPVVNLHGEVIGVSARRGGPTVADPTAPMPGSGYALPSNIANAIFQSLLIRENKESPWLGISVLAMSDSTRKRLGDGKPGGILIDNVFDPSPATAAGIRVGDILRSMAGVPIGNVHDFQRLLYLYGPGTPVRLGLVRERKPLEVSATIARRPPEATTR